MIFLQPKTYNLKPNQEGQAPILEFRKPEGLKRSKFSTGQARIVKMWKSKLSKNPNFTTGQAALSLVLLVGGTVVLIAATLFFLVVSFINSTFGFQAANQAWGLAISGANEGLLQLSRNPTMAETNLLGFDVDGKPVKVELQRGCVWLGEDIGCETDDDSGITRRNQVRINSSVAVSGRSSRLSVFASVSQEGKVDIIEVRYFGVGGGAGVF